jgi:NAD(P)-dependent dehydrogenase (short-subunit alcohol dehydrogenase family)
VAVVSGAASGQGRAISLRLAEFGADLVLLDLNSDGVSQVPDSDF